MLVANGFGRRMNPPEARSSPNFVLAPAKTSAGAPCCRSAASVSVPAKVNRIDTPRWAMVNISPIMGKDFASDAAASTPSEMVAPWVAAPDGEYEPHPAPAISATTISAVRPRWARRRERNPAGALTAPPSPPG